jgi:hypothetical protein
MPSLPTQELRNEIYFYVAHAEETVTIFDISHSYFKLRTPALAQTCRQIRQESRDVFASETPRYATKFVTRLTNFRAEHLPYALDKLPGPAESVQRSYLLKVFVDNTWWNYLSDLAELDRGMRVGSRKDFEIDFDPKSFDVESCRPWLRARREGRAGEEDPHVGKIVEAFELAFERYGKGRSATMEEMMVG